jgi:hypothetical protein
MRRVCTGCTSANPSTLEAEAGSHEFEVILSYKTKPYLKIKRKKEYMV